MGLNPTKMDHLILGCFGGSTIWGNTHYISNLETKSRIKNHQEEISWKCLWPVGWLYALLPFNWHYLQFRVLQSPCPAAGFATGSLICPSRPWHPRMAWPGCANRGIVWKATLSPNSDRWQTQTYLVHRSEALRAVKCCQWNRLAIKCVLGRVVENATAWQSNRNQSSSKWRQATSQMNESGGVVR